MKRTSLLVSVLVLLVVFANLVVVSSVLATDAEQPTFRMSLAHGKQVWVEDPRNQYLHDLIESTYSVKLDPIYLNAHGGLNSPTIESMIQSILEGDYATQLYVVNSDDIPLLVRDGLIQPLDDALHELEFFENLPTVYRNTDFFKLDGRTWAVDRSVLSHTATGILWNMDLFEREGFPNLYELYEAGEWTWDVFREIAIAATKDTTGDGEIDQVGLSTFQHYANTPSLILPWIASNNGTLTRTVDGREIVTLNEEPALEALDFWADLTTNDAVRFGEYPKFGRGESAMMNFQLWMSRTRAQGWIGFRDMEDEWGVVPLPRGPRATEHIAPFIQAWVIVAPVTTQDPATALDIWSIMFNKSAKYVDVDAFHEEELYRDYSINIRNHTGDNNLRWILGNASYIPYAGLIYEGGFVPALDKIINQGMSASAVMSEIEPVIQGILNDILNQ